MHRVDPDENTSQTQRQTYGQTNSTYFIGPLSKSCSFRVWIRFFGYSRKEFWNNQYKKNEYN